MASRMQGKTNQPAKHRIVIVDDHPIVRQGLAQLIEQEDDLHICGQAEDAHEAIRAIRELNPNLVIVDISLRTSSGIDLIKDIKAQFPALPVLTLSMHDEALYAERALRAGARGYIMKQEAPEEVVTAIRRVLAGTTYISQGMAAKMVNKIVAGPGEKNASPVDRLSDRELEVFRLIGEGYGTREMAEKLYLSVKTIETYRAHIKEKLNLQDANELLRAAIRWANAQM
ncbi:response regulator transcription factor [Anaerobaca lacustris]|uniref:Response regulator transcription factor n=1 Tax=Anaerobaca lacustris TaxID=3044600 RepID=A0AAW6U5A8_9BACT|nr:response regulator transcription factor [Sedimentisphaerales bacterium M17dextr]